MESIQEDRSCLYRCCFLGLFLTKKNESDFLEFLKSLDARKIKKGDGVIVDKGFFFIKVEIERVVLVFPIPSFAPGSGQMSAKDISFTEKIASHRVHVERAISSAKTFKILDERIDLCLFPCVNQIWFCCVFNLLYALLIQDEWKILTLR